MRPLQNSAPRRLAALALALASLAAARGAEAAITVNVAGSTNTYEFGLSACNAGTSIPFTYAITTSTYAPGAAGVVITAYASTTSSCTAGATTNVNFTVADQSATTATINVPPLNFLATTTCAADTHTSSSPGIAAFCVQLTYNGTLEDTGTLAVNYAMTPPTPPALSSIVVEPGDQQLHVAWSPADANQTIATWQIYCQPDGVAFDSSKYAAQVTTSTSVTVGQTDEGAALINEMPYSIAISATDTYGNTSALSAASEGNIPYPVDDFYQYYRSKGGSAVGCSSGGGGAFWALLAGALALLFRRRRARRAGGAALLLGLGLLSSAGGARAEDSDYNISNLNAPMPRAPRRLFFALEADRYKPHVDSEKDLNGATPYQDIFGHRVPWRVQAEVSVELVHLRYFGTLLAGGSVGFWQNIGKGIFSGGPNAGKASNDTTLLDIWPFGVEAQWRFDMLADRFRWFPLIPYAKAGLMAALWTIYSGNGDVSTSAAVAASGKVNAQSAGRGQGWTTGYTTAIGGAIALDAIDPGISNEAYLDLGLQRTSVFAEYGWTRLDQFQHPGRLILTDRGWRFGLSMEF